MPIYLKLATVQGESTAKDHEGWIEVDSASFGVSRKAPSEKSGDKISATTDMTFTKQTDSVSALLMRMVTVGGPSQPATVDFVDKDGDVYLRLELSDAVVTSLITRSSKESRANESFTLNFTKMVVRRFVADTTPEAQQALHVMWTDVQP